jgi:hypothetical protein
MRLQNRAEQDRTAVATFLKAVYYEMCKKISLHSVVVNKHCIRSWHYFYKNQGRLARNK